MRSKKIIFLFSLCFFTFVSVFGQQGKYIKYTVKKGESIRKIAKRNGLKSRDLLKLNPDVKRRPKANTIILIPNKNYREDAVVITPSQIHTVLPKETLFGISKKYSVSIDALKGANPQLREEGLKIGMTLEIPNNKILSKEEQLKLQIEEWSKDYILHTVVKDDTFYSLTRFYGISKTDLEILNPNLIEGLKLGTVLKIKKKEEEPLVVDLDVEISAENENVNLYKDSIIIGKKINVAMLLPFKFRKNDTLKKEKIFSSKLENIITDFYLGAEIAIDSLRKQGVAIDLKAYDTDNDKDCFIDLFEENTFSSTDIVFGPVYSKYADMVASELKDIPVVYPFYSRSQNKFQESNLIKTATERSVFEEKVVNHFKDTYKNQHIVLIGDSKISSKIRMQRIAEALKENDSITSVSLLQSKNGYINKKRFVAAVDTLGVNWVLLTSNRNDVTADVVNNLKSLPNNPKVKLFAIEKGDNFENVDNNILASMNFTYASDGVFIDTTSNVTSFYKEYLKKNFTYPSKNAIRGFDVVYDVLSRMASKEKSAIKTIRSTYNEGISNRLGTTFFYDKKWSIGPSYNKSVYLMKYNEDLSIDILESPLD